jgi:hypothetical protein
MPSSEVRDLRQLLLHRHKLVTIRTRVKNELQHLCLNQGVQRKHKLWSKAGQQVDWVEIKWPQPSGLLQRINNPPIDRYITIVEGQDWRG